MNLLALDTSTETLSLAVMRGDTVWSHEGPGAAQASASLLPAIEDLLRQAGLRLQALDAIVFGQGPGSFTGLRTACAVTQGLALGAGLPVLPLMTLLAVAEEARHVHGVRQVVAALDARMGEIYAAEVRFAAGPALPQVTPARLLRPQELQLPEGWALAGNVQGLQASGLAQAAQCLPALPTARALLRLAPAFLAAGQAVAAAQAWPLYIREKVAKTTLEREAEKAAASAAA